MEWNEEVIARLRALWAEGLSTAEIGRRLNVSKNAVVGKAHRLNLPPRPSPIRRAPAGPLPERPHSLVAVEPGLPSLPPHTVQAAMPVPVPVPAVVAPPAMVALATVPPALPDPAPAVVTRIVQAPRPVEVPRPVLRSVGAASTGRVSACCWPIGEPGTKAFCFCDAPSTPGKPYCREHAAIAYVKVRDRREEAA